jgi:hypothetical protein
MMGVRVRARVRARARARARARIKVRVRVRVRKLLTSVPLKAVRHCALQPCDRAVLLLGHALTVSGQSRVRGEYKA